jgi:hypothetical protein
MRCDTACLRWASKTTRRPQHKLLSLELEMVVVI